MSRNHAKHVIWLAVGWLALHAHAAFAGCALSAGTDSHLVLPGELSAKRDTAVGVVLFDSGWLSDGTRADVNCSGAFVMAVGYESAMTAAPGMANVYQTGVPGLGIRVTYTNHKPVTDSYVVPVSWPKRTSSENGGPGIQYLPWGLFRVEYVVTGPLGSGTMSLPSPLAKVTYGGVTTNKVTFNRTSVNIVSTGCRITNNDIAVNLPDVAAAAFNAVGATPASRDFSIDLSCDADVAVSYRIDATPPAGIPLSTGVVAAAAGAGQATGVGVRISQAGAVVPLGSKLSYLRTATAGEAVSIPLTGSYYATALPVRGGALSAVATFSLFYE